MLEQASPSSFLDPVNPVPTAGTIHVMIGTPTLGLIRIEWVNAMAAMALPPNWSTVRSSPVGFLVPDAQNMLVDAMLRAGCRSLLLIEDDTCPPPHAMLAFDRWFTKMDHFTAPPVVSGLYFIKNSAEVRQGDSGGIELLGPEPLIYRGAGTRAFRDWTMGDVVWCDGIPTGALLIHRRLLEAWAKEPDMEEYLIPGYPYPVKKIFRNPSKVWVDPSSGTANAASGTSDLWWSSETIKRDLIRKAGWPEEFASRQYPYIVDTAIRFGHVDRTTGIVY